LQCKKVTSRSLKKAYAAINNRFPEHLEQCRAFLRQKSISATGEGIVETAGWVTSLIEELGRKVVLWGNPSFPIVFGRLDTGCPRALIVYDMYDVLPEEESNWISPPFAAEIHRFPGIGECVVAWGAVNSKGALCGLFKDKE
jgi:acetylornithine deacetylase/succinyl-diaminopimelate desuccinylase-like protein